MQPYKGYFIREVRFWFIRLAQTGTLAESVAAI